MGDTPSPSDDHVPLAVHRDAIGTVLTAGSGNKITNRVTIIHQYASVDDRTAADGHPALPRGDKPSANPYKGLEAFYEEDADRFFGRDGLIDDLWNRLRLVLTPTSPNQPVRPRFLAIIGPSGSGKSSVARAGLLPELARRPLPGLANARVAVMVPGTDPLASVAAVLARIAHWPDPAPAAKSREFAEELRVRSQQGIADGLRRIASILPGSDRHPLVLLVDQFEEMFTGADKTDLQPETIERLFIDNLIDAASTPNARITVVLTLRADFLSATSRYPKLDSAIAAASKLVPAMTVAELKQAIARPAENAGYPLDLSTIDLLAEEAVGRVGALPLLQFALARIWEGRQHGKQPADTLRDLGGVGGALAAEADRLMHDLKETNSERVVRRAFLRMTQLGEGTQDTRRRAKLSEIVAHDEDSDQVLAVLRRFSQRDERLITIDSDHNETMLEVTHEQLITSWPTLQNWLRDWRDDERFYRRMDAAADAWRKGEGALWGPIELGLLRRWQQRFGADVTTDQLAFMDASLATYESDRRRTRRTLLLTRIAAATFFTALLAAGVLALGLFGSLEETNRQRQIASTQASQAERQTGRGQTSLARVENERGRSRAAVIAALAGLPETIGEPVNLDYRQAIDELHRALFRDRLLVPRLVHRDIVRAVAFDAAGDRVITASDDGTARIWDARTGQPIGIPMQHGGPVLAAAFDTAGDRVVTASFDHFARIWDARTGQQIGKAMQHDDQVLTATFDKTGDHVLTASDDHTARIWDAHTGKSIGEPLRHDERVWAAAFDATGDRVVTASDDHTARIWDAHTGAPIGEPMRHSGSVATAAFDVAGDRVVTASTDNTARIWDAYTGKPIGEPMRHDHSVYVAAFDAVGDHVVTASGDKTARIWDARTGEPIGVPMRHNDLVTTAAFDATGDRVVTASWDKTARIWDAHTGQPIGLPMQHDERVQAAAFNTAGDRIVTASDDRTARIWDARADQPIGLPMRHDRWVNTAAFDATGERVVTASDDNTGRIWDAHTGQPIGEPMRHGRPVLAAAFNAAGDRVVTASFDKTARIWDARTGQPIGKFMQHAGPVRAAVFDAAGDRIVTASNDKTAHLWDARTGAPIGEPMRHDDSVVTAAFDATGDRVVTASDDNTARIWDAHTGKPIGEPMRHDDSVSSAAFDAAGDRIVTASLDKTARIWDAHTGKPIGEPMRHEHAAFHAAFDATGDRIVTVSDRTVYIWDARTGLPIGDPMRHDGPVKAAAFDATGDRVVTASDRTARIWDARTGIPISEPMQHDSDVIGAAFDTAGDRIVTVCLDRTARIWDVPPFGQQLIDLARSTLGPTAPPPTRPVRASVTNIGFSTVILRGLGSLLDQVTRGYYWMRKVPAR